jgi:hypothetical protein
VPFGVDPRGRPIVAPMFEVNRLIGAAPGRGKTNAMRGLACGVALEQLARASHRYCSGLYDEAIAPMRARPRRNLGPNWRADRSGSCACRSTSSRTQGQP